MAVYTFPDVYIEKQKSTIPNVAIASSNATTGGFIGRAPRGVRNTPVKIASWQGYLNAFAKGIVNPFEMDSYLAYCVYNFFANGGTELYVLNATDGKEKPAKASLTSGSSSFAIEAGDAGTWGNKLWLSVEYAGENEEPSDGTGTYNVYIYLGDTADEDTLVDQFLGVTSATVYNAISASTTGYVKHTFSESTKLASTESPIQFTGGSDGGSVTDYATVLTAFDKIDDISMLALADSGTVVDDTALIAYCTKRDDVVAIMGVESEKTTPDEVLTKYKDIAGRGFIAYPWTGFTDPISGEVKLIPNQGKVMGEIVRSITTRGLGKVPAGVNSVLIGAVSVATELDDVTAGKLNNAHVACIMNKKGYGIVMWGGRSRLDSRYINGLLLETMISRDLYNGLQPYVFEPNEPTTWKNARRTCNTYMNDLWKNKAFKEGQASEVYLVTCDETNNTAESIADHILNVYVAYAEKGCAEFVVVKLSRELSAE